MALQLFFFFVGMLGLYLGADWVVRGATRIARSTGISSLVIGLTLVSMGTSAPELVVSGLAAARDQGEIALGNVIGSNIVNVALILGIAATISTVIIQVGLIAREIPIMIAASLLALVLALDGTLSRFDGAILVTCMVGFLTYIVGAARKRPESDSAATDGGGDASRGGLARQLALVAAGCGLLIFGAQLLVGASIHMGEMLGVSEAVIGVTVIALGTSLPELATSTVAALRRELDVAVGNVVGSNLFNVLAILGVSSMIAPIPVPPEILRFEFMVMLAFSLLLLPLAITQLRIARWEGIAFLIGYAVFIVALLIRAGVRPPF